MSRDDIALVSCHAEVRDLLGCTLFDQEQNFRCLTSDFPKVEQKDGIKVVPILHADIPLLGEEKGTSRHYPLRYTLRRLAQTSALVLGIHDAAGLSPGEKTVLQEMQKGGGSLHFALEQRHTDTRPDITAVQREIAGIIGHPGRPKIHILTWEDAQTLETLTAALLKRFPVSRQVAWLDYVTHPNLAKANAEKQLIQRAAKQAGAVGIVPGLDLLGVVPLQIKLIRDVARLHGQPVTKQQAQELLILLSGGYISRRGGRVLLSRIPGVRLVAGPALAYSSTQALGKVASFYFESGRSLDREQIKKRFEELLELRKPGK
jgi:uncharacterized protein (DUF697 family)